MPVEVLPKPTPGITSGAAEKKRREEVAEEVGRLANLVANWRNTRRDEDDIVIFNWMGDDNTCIGRIRATTEGSIFHIETNL